MLREDRNRLRHILDAAEEAMQLASAKSRADLDSDRVLALALVRLLEIVGGASANVSLTVRTANPEIPWRELTGMRHRLIHAYHSVNLDAVWSTIQYDLPPLAAHLQQLLSPPASSP